MNGKGKGSGGKQKGKNPQSNGGKKPKEQKESASAPKFPDYDAMQVGESLPSSASSSASGDDKLKRIMKELVESNSVKLSEEAMKLLQEEDDVDFRSEMKRAQVSLNKKRKAHAKLQRLKDALQVKHEQFKMFKKSLRDQLVSQQEKYDEDVASLHASIEEAEAALKKIVEEVEDTVPEEPPMNNGEPEDDLDKLLDVQKAPEKMVVHLEEQLRESREETATTKRMFNAQAAQMQSYMQRLEQVQSMLTAFHGHMGDVSALLPPGLPLPPTPLSPQLVRTPTLPKRNDPAAPFGRVQVSKQDPKKPRSRSPRNTSKSPHQQSSAIVVGDSPPKVTAQEGLDLTKPGMGAMD